MRTRVAAAALLIAAGLPAVAGVKAKFLGDGTYATPEGCAKLKAIAAGGPKNISTTPETLTASGFSGWEFGCGFTSVKEVVKGRKWVGKAACSEGPETWKSSDTFERLPDGSFNVTGDKKTMKFVRCETGQKTGETK